jgi:hypothetical protein
MAHAGQPEVSTFHPNAILDFEMGVFDSDTKAETRDDENSRLADVRFARI